MPKKWRGGKHEKSSTLQHILNFKFKNFAIVNVILRQWINRSSLSSPRVRIGLTVKMVQGVHGYWQRIRIASRYHRLLASAMIDDAIIHSPSSIIVHFLRFLTRGFVDFRVMQSVVLVVLDSNSA